MHRPLRGDSGCGDKGGWSLPGPAVSAAERAAGRVALRPGGEGAAPGSALRDLVPESLMGRAAAGPEPPAEEMALPDGD